MKKLIGLLTSTAVLLALSLLGAPGASADEPTPPTTGETQLVASEVTSATAEAPTVTGEDVAAGATMAVEATGFDPDEDVRFALVGPVTVSLGSAEADSAGDVAASFTVPTTVVSGDYELTATGMSSALSASDTVTISGTGKYFLLIFDARGGSVSTTSKTITLKAKYGTLPKPTRTGYTFLGWFTKASGGTKVTSSTKLTTASDKTVYAHWKAKSYKLSFNANGGTVKTKSKTVKMDKSYGTIPKPTRKGHAFQGWYTAKSGGTIVTKSDTFTKASSQTLYAQWNAKSYNVKLNPRLSEIATTSITVTYNSTYWELPTLVKMSLADRADSRFLGWYTKASGGTKIKNTATVKITSSKTLYAHWKHPLKALCKDGSYSYAKDVDKVNYQGQCSSHGGIKKKLGRVP